MNRAFALLGHSFFKHLYRSHPPRGTLQRSAMGFNFSLPSFLWVIILLIPCYGSGLMTPSWPLLRKGEKALAMHHEKTRPVYIFGVEDVFVLFSQKENKIWMWYRGCGHRGVPDFQRWLRTGPWSGLPCPQGKECLLTIPAKPLCRESSCLQSIGRPGWHKCLDVLHVAESSSPHPGSPTCPGAQMLKCFCSLKSGLLWSWDAE